MKCPTENWEDADLVAFATENLDADRGAQLQQHLQSCVSCRRVVEQQRAVWQALDAWEAPAISTDFDQRLYRRIEQKASWWSWIDPARLFLVRQGLPVAAAACLIVVAGFVSQRPAEPPAPKAAQIEGVQAEQVEHALDDIQMLGDFTHAARAEEGDL